MLGPSSLTTIKWPYVSLVLSSAFIALTRSEKSLLDDITARRIPVELLELFDAENVPFYEGASRATIYPQLR